MGYVKEPEGVDFVVAPGQLSDEDKLAFKNAFAVVKVKKWTAGANVVVSVNLTDKIGVVYKPVGIKIFPQQIIFQAVSSKTGKRVNKKVGQVVVKRKKTT